MKKVLIIIFLFSSFIGFSQETNKLEIDSKVLILKIKDSHRGIIKTDGISHYGLNKILEDIEYTYLEKMFPMHRPPERYYDEFGNKLVDLSLIYQLKYNANIQNYILITKLQNLNIFEYVENYPDINLLAIPNDSLIYEQFHLDQMQLFDAWDIEEGDTNVVIGITDTGTDRLHEDLKNIKYNYADPIDGIDNDNDGFIDNFYGWDIGDNNNNPQVDLIGHGAFVTGISSAQINNFVGIAGVGGLTKYLPIKISDSKASLLRAYEGIVYAADQNCDIINASWGGMVGSRFGQDIVNYATFNKNSLIVAAAGNSNSDYFIFPASYKNVLSIAAVDSLDQRWGSSSFGPTVDLSAPGDKVYSSWQGDVYFNSSGTSFAAPAIAGIAALVKSKFDSLNALQIGEKIRVNTDKIDTISSNIAFKYDLGSGRANAYKALTDSTSPAIRVKNYDYYSTGNQALDTVYLYAKFTNFLQTTHNAKAIISTNSPFISIIDSVFEIGSLKTLQDTNNQHNKFKILILPNLPYGYQTDLKISYSDTSYSDFEFIRIQLNEDYKIIDTNNISLSLSSNGTIAFTNESKSQGIGMYYKNRSNILEAGGLVLANSSNRVSDNIYDDNKWGHDFNVIKKIESVNPQFIWDEEYYNIFNDDSASNTKLDLSVYQNSYASNKNDYENFVVLDYTIFNNSISDYNNFYVGFYVDFDIDISSRNFALYNADKKLSYTTPATGGIYAGIKIINDNDSSNVYNFDNDGSNNSINIYDGLLDFEKYDAMITQRDSAGFLNPNGKDVSTLISKGPFYLPSGDSVNVKFALLAADFLPQLLNIADKIDKAFSDDASKISENDKQALKLSINPNPVTDVVELNIFSTSELNSIILIYDELGKVVMTSTQNLKIANNKISIDISHLNSGVYYIKVESDNGTISEKIIKLF